MVQKQAGKRSRAGNHYAKRSTGRRRRRRRQPAVLRRLLLFAVIVMVGLVIWRQIPYYLYPNEYSTEIETAARENGIDPYLVCAVIKVESNFNADAVSSAGAVGLMQIMPKTAEWLAGLDGSVSTAAQLYEPEYNIRLGCRYLRFLLDHWEWDVYKAVASYNAGQNNVAQWLAEGIWDGTANDLQNIPFAETQQYVNRVFNIYQQYLSLY